MRRAFLLAILLLATRTSGQCLIGEEASQAHAARRLRFCLGEVGIMAPLGLAGRALEFDYLYGGLKLGAAAAEGFGGLSGNVSGVVSAVRAGVMFMSRYEPDAGTATNVRELSAEVGAGLRPT